MNKLNTFLSFVLLSFCLLINVSYAEFTTDVITTTLSYYPNTTVNNPTYGEYEYSQIRSICNNYYKYSDNASYVETFNTMVNSLMSSGYDITVQVNGSYVFSYIYKNADLAWLPGPYSAKYIIFTRYNNSISDIEFGLGSATDNNVAVLTDFVNEVYRASDYPTILFSTKSIKLFNSVSSLSGTLSLQWDGESYAYVSPIIPDEPDEPETPTMPTNAEIASAVQLFYNSVYQYSNAFDDFFVLYDTSTKLYTYVGHTRGNALGQVIVEPNGYYDGYKFDVQWWKFFLDEQEDSWNWQNISKYFNYYVYTSDGTIESLKDIGYSNISGLLSDGPWATSTTIIVYSTTDYPVKYITFSDDSPEPNIQTGVIEGDQYTYDENLDITDNNYNPLDSFVTIDYPSTLVSRADFEGFMNIFNENSQFAILPSNANWIVIANNSLFEHFSSFIIMCTVFIILQRFMRG